MTTQTRTLIVGLGETGIATMQWCQRQGDRVRVIDTRHNAEYVQSIATKFVDVEWCLGSEYIQSDGTWCESVLNNIERIVLSPGLSPFNSPLRELLAAARTLKINVIGEIELFAQALKHLELTMGYRPKVLAITGTNGKTTVTALTAFLIQDSGLTAQVAGNISPAALTALVNALDAGKLPDVWVLELSSFQLESTESLAPWASAVLNVSQDHLDWHGSFDAYVQAKAKLIELSNVSVVNRDDAIVMGMVAHLDDVNIRSFGSDEPRFEQDLGIERVQGLNWMVSVPLQFKNEEVKPKKGSLLTTHRQNATAERLMPADALLIRGMHNVLNAQAALVLARTLDISWRHLLTRIREYRGERHRVEFVRTVQGIDYIDDSKGTNVGATIAALKGLDRSIVLIAGGQGKGQNFSELIPAIVAHAKAVLLIGEAAPVLHQLLAQTTIPHEVCVSLQMAVRRAHDIAHDTDVVLLSPACASLDMFNSYAHRAQVFIDEVHSLAADKGEV